MKKKVDKTRFTIIHCADFDAYKDEHVTLDGKEQALNEQSRITWSLNCYCVLVQHPVLGNVLFDTGIDSRWQTRWPRNLAEGYPVARSFNLKEKLLELGLLVDDIDYLIISHLHFDHAGNLWMFRGTKAGAGVIVQEEEVRHAFLQPRCGNLRKLQKVPGVVRLIGKEDSGVKKTEDFIIGVIGSGTMGLGVATHFAMHGHQVRLFSRKEGALEKARKQISENLRSMQELGVINSETAGTAEQLVSYYSDMEAAVSGADLVIENVLESEDVKKSAFAQLDQYCRPDAILASNTIMYPIAWTDGREKDTLLGGYKKPCFGDRQGDNIKRETPFYGQVHLERAPKQIA